MSGQGGLELHGVIDEEDDGAQPSNFDPRIRAPKKKKQFDWNQIFAYKTYRIVRIRDRYLGMLYWAIAVSVMVYIIIVAIGMEGKHQTQEPGVGLVMLRIKGKVYNDKDQVFDEADLRYPEIESAAAFIATRSVTMRKQKIDTCVDFDKSCGKPDQPADICGTGNTCTNGYCNMPKVWCPSLGIGNADSLTATNDIVIDKMTKGVEDLTLSFETGMSFPGLTGKENNFFVAGRYEFADKESDTDSQILTTSDHVIREITLKDLLARANVNFNDIRDKGMILSVAFYWNCNVREDCDPTPVVNRIDNGQGYFQRRPSAYYKDGAEQTRDATFEWGIRILVDSSGIGKKSTIVLLVIQLGSCLALLRTASITADFIMLNCFRKEKTDMYYKCKVIETQDYSDLQDRINVIKDTEKETSRLLRKNRNYGMGAGGRGGIASQILQ